MGIIQDLKNSFNSPAYYRASLNWSLRESLAAYTRFALTLALVMTVLVAILIIPQIPQLFNGGVSKWLAQVPADMRDGITPAVANQLQTFVDGWQNNWPIVAPLLVLVSFVAFVFVLALQLVGFFLWALVTWWLAKGRGWLITYRQAYQLTLIAGRPSLVVSYLGLWFMPPFIIGIISLVIFIWVLWRNIKKG